MTKTSTESVPHLRDLFIKGRELKIETGDEENPIIEVWIRKPSSTQRDYALRKARTKKARRRAELLSPNSAEHQTMLLEIQEMDIEEVIEELVRGRSSELRRQATNEVLFNPEIGSDWGKDGEKYFSLLDARLEVQDQILREAEENQTTPDFESNEEYKRLASLEEQFQAEVAERETVLRDDYRAQVASEGTPEELRKKLFNKYVDAESEMVWFAEFRTNMIYQAVRRIDDHSKLYFESVEELLDMPLEIQTQLFNAYDQIEMAGDIKNSPTPPPS